MCQVTWMVLDELEITFSVGAGGGSRREEILKFNDHQTMATVTAAVGRFWAAATTATRALRTEQQNKSEASSHRFRVFAR